MRPRTSTDPTRHSAPAWLLVAALTLAAFSSSPATAQEAPPPSDQPQPGEVPAEDDDLLTRQIIVGGTVVSVYAAAGTWAYFAWYRNQKISEEFLVRDEGWFGAETYAGGADKLGHMYSNYITARGTSQLLQYGGFEPLTATLVANGLTLAFFTGIELKDAYHAGFGFSYGDMVANTAGNGLALMMEMSPEIDRAISFRFEYTPSADYIELVRETGTVDAAEDYSGQRFLLAYHLASLDIEDPWWRWLRFGDIVTGYYTRNFLPEPSDPDAYRARRLFLGVAINVQQIVDEVFFDTPSGAAYGVTHFATEVLAVPFTTFDVIGLEALDSPVIETF